MKLSQEYLEFTPNGFIRHTRRWLWYWKHEAFEWDTVQSINALMWDCFSFHAFGFRLIMSDSTSVCVTDNDKQWDDFRSRLYDVFPDIDSNRVEDVEGYFPGEGELTCWKLKKPNKTLHSTASS